MLIYDQPISSLPHAILLFHELLKVHVSQLFMYGQTYKFDQSNPNYSNISLIIISVNPTLTDGTSKRPSKLIAGKLRVIMI